METLSNSLTNLLSKSKFTSLLSNLHHNKKLKLLVGHVHAGVLYFSLLPTNKNISQDDDDDAICFNFPRLGPHFFPAASCKSLLLSHVDPNRRVALWNPTTDEVKKLPGFPRGSLIWSYGFGLDPASQDYKVVRYVRSTCGYRNRAKPFQVELYSLKTDSWKDITAWYPYSNFPVGPATVHINGFCYWAVGADSIISFDFANERFSFPPCIPLPETDMFERNRFRPPSNFFLTDFHGSLAALVYTDHGRVNYCITEEEKKEKPFQFEIWSWNGESWTRVPTYVIPNAVAATVEKPLGLFGNDQLYLRGSGGKILLFDCATGILKDLSLNADHRNGLHVFPYLESSFSLSGQKIIRASSKMIKYNNNN